MFIPEDKLKKCWSYLPLNIKKKLGPKKYNHIKSIKKFRLYEVIFNFLFRRDEIVKNNSEDYYNNKFFSYLDKVDHENLKKLYLIYFYSFYSNQGQMEKRIYEILDENPIENIFYIQNAYRPEVIQKTKTLLNYINSTVNLIQKKLKDDYLKRIFAQYFLQGMELEEKNKFLKNNDVGLSLVEVRSITKSIYYGAIVGGGIEDYFKLRLSDLEYKKFVQKVFGFDKNFQGIYNLDWIYPKIEDYNEHIINRFVKLFNSTSNYENFKALNMLENAELKKELTKRKLIEDRPIFEFQRDLYMKLLFSGIAKEYAVFHLIQMGDYNSNYIDLLINGEKI